VDVSLPFLNEPEPIDSTNEQSPSPEPDTQKTFEFDSEEKFDSDDNEVDPELNMMQILHAESPQQSLLVSVPDRCDLHRPPSCLPDVDDGDTNSLSDKESSCYSEPDSSGQTREEDAMDEWRMSEEDEGSDTTDLGLLNEEKQAAVLVVQPSDEPSDTDGCTHCEVYTMTFGGMYAYTVMPSTEIDDGGKLDNEEEEKVDLKKPDQGEDVLLASKAAGGTPYEVYTMNFGGLYTFTTATGDAVTEPEPEEQTEEKLSERDESSLIESDGVEGKIDEQSESVTPYEVYTVSFGGLHAFTATPIGDGAGGVNDSEPLLLATSRTSEADTGSSQMPTESQEQSEELKVDKDGNQTMDGHAICTPYEVHTVTFGGLYTFTASLPPIRCDGAPPMHAA
jgi:hypothetical protein